MRALSVAVLLLTAGPAFAGTVGDGFEYRLTRLDAANLVMSYRTLDAIPDVQAPLVGRSIERLTKELVYVNDSPNAAWNPGLHERVLAFASETQTIHPELRALSAAFIAEAQWQRYKRERPALPSLRELALAKKDDAHPADQFYDRAARSGSTALVVGDGPFRATTYREPRAMSLKKAEKTIMTRAQSKDELNDAVDAVTEGLSSRKHAERLLADLDLRKRVRLIAEAHPEPHDTLGESARRFMARALEVELPEAELDARHRRASEDFLLGDFGLAMTVGAGALVSGFILGAPVLAAAGALAIAFMFERRSDGRRSHLARRIEGRITERPKLPPGS